MIIFVREYVKSVMSIVYKKYESQYNKSIKIYFSICTRLLWKTNTVQRGVYILTWGYINNNVN